METAESKAAEQKAAPKESDPSIELVRNEGIKLDPTSSNLQLVSYHEELEALIVDFNSGASYLYCPVPKTVFDEFTLAESKGRFFTSHVKDVFEGKKILKS